jgi:hypothetical protein
MTRIGSRVREFFQEGGIVASREGGSLSRMIAGLGMASLVAIVPITPTPADASPQVIKKLDKPLPDMTMRTLDREAETFLQANIAEMIENATVHKYGDYAVPHSVAKAIVRAANETDFPADYLMAIAEKESSFRANSKAERGTAKGYFGFIEQTWFSAVKRNGADYGLGDAASAIVQKKNKRGQRYWDIEDKQLRQEVLDLRDDPYVAAVMTAIDLRDARKRIEERINAVMKDEDLYLPHFLGEDAAEDVIVASVKKPGVAARAMLPRAAQYNKAMFHDSKGRPLSVAQFRTRIQSVISTRAEKYAEVAVDVERASLTSLYEVSTASISRRPDDPDNRAQDLPPAIPRQ